MAWPRRSGPMLISMRCSIAIFCSAGNLNAVAHRGNFEVYRASRDADRQLNTRRRFRTQRAALVAPLLAERDHFIDAVAFFQCGSTGNPHLRGPDIPHAFRL
jgi:hypothetical protein